MGSCSCGYDDGGPYGMPSWVTCDQHARTGVPGRASCTCPLGPADCTLHGKAWQQGYAAGRRDAEQGGAR